jgi:hypothetical protein
MLSLTDDVDDFVRIVTDDVDCIVDGVDSLSVLA